MICTRSRLFLLLLTFLSVLSCAPKEYVEKVPEMYWPLPPEKPRIKFVNLVLGSADAKMESGKIKSLLFGVEGDVRFVKPFGVAFAGQKLFVTDIGGVYSFDFAKGEFKIFGRDELRVPAGIAATDERVYVGDVARKRIYVYDTSGRAVMNFGAGKVDTPGGIAIDKIRGRLIVSDARRNVVDIFNTDGGLISSIGSRGREHGEFNIPYGVAVDKEGRVYVVDSGNFRLQIFDQNGKFLKQFGGVGTSPGNFARPKGVAVDSDGNIYVLDAAFGNFQIFDFDGNTLLAVGNTGVDPGEFMLPSSIYIDAQDRIYITDQINKRIQIFQYLKDKPKKEQSVAR